MNGRQRHRVLEDYQALQRLAAEGFEGCRCFRCHRLATGFVWDYEGLPGPAQTGHGLILWQSWQAVVALGARYPVEAPRIFVSAAGCTGVPFHPNILPTPPYLLCYGRHQPVLLLDGLARRVARILRLDRGAVMTDERNSLHPLACQPVRRLLQEGAAPLRADVPFPAWCHNLITKRVKI